MREVRVGQLLFDLGGLGLDFFQLFFQPRRLGFLVNQTFQRQKQIAQLGAHRQRVFAGLIIRAHLDRLGVEQQPEHFDVVRRQFTRRFEDEPDFLVRGDVRRAAQVAALRDKFVPRLDVFLIAFGQAVMRFEIVIERLRPRREHDGRAALVFRHVLGVSHPVPEFLRDKRQERMKQPQRVRENKINHRQSIGLARRIICSSRREEALINTDFRRVLAIYRSFRFFRWSFVTSAATG